MIDIGKWLDELGLGKYTDVFVDNDIDLQVLPDLDETHLEKLGVSLGHRLKLLKAVAALSADVTPRTSAAAQSPTTPDLSNKSQMPDELPVKSPPAGAERRQLTVMFCDLVGSTALSTVLDPEDLRDVILRYQETCTQIVQDYGGYVARYMGDGILVYFGYPKASEFDAEQALRTALGIVEAMRYLNAEQSLPMQVKLAVRIGLATGTVIVGDLIGKGSSEERPVVGETPNLAARLQGEAEPNGIVIGSVTKHLAGDGFSYQDLGELTLKGINEQVQSWAVLGEREIDEVDTITRQGDRPLIGREEELELLRQAWARSQDGAGQVVLIGGEPGIGKSHLIDAIKADLDTENRPRISVRCSPQHTNSVLYPIIQCLQRVFGWQREDSDARKLVALERTMSDYAHLSDNSVPLLATLMSLTLPEGRYATLALNPRHQKQQTLDLLVAWMNESAKRQPSLWVWEDLHWADPSTLELLTLQVERCADVPILNVLTFRPDFIPPWSTHTHMTTLELTRLGRSEILPLIIRHAGGKSLPDEVVEHIVSKSDGVPLYIEELTKVIATSDFLRDMDDRYELTRPLSDIAIPATLQDSLMERLDRFPMVLKVAQLGAVLGREFSYEMLRAISMHEESALIDSLGHLVTEELLYQRGRPPRAQYIFKHALIRDMAYQSLLRRARRQHHQQVAELLESRFPDTVNTHPELVAHHYSEATDVERAIDYWHRAGDLALTQGANVEAVSHLSAALDELTELDENSDRLRCELELQTKLGPAICATRGFANPRVGQCYARAQTLGEVLGDTKKLAVILRGQQLSEMVSGDLNIANAIAVQLAEVAERQGESSLRAGSCLALAGTSVYLGRLTEGLEHAERGIKLIDPKGARIENWPGGQPGEGCFMWAGLATWLVGEPDTALARMHTMLEMVRSGEQQFNLAAMLGMAAHVPAWRGDFDAVRQWAEESISISKEHGIDQWLRWGQILLAWIDAKQAPSITAVDALEASIRSFETIGMRITIYHFLALLADCCLDTGEHERGLKVIDRALAVSAENNERWMEAEVHRIRGELLHAHAPHRIDDAEASVRYALNVARTQGARSLELRALQSLVRIRPDEVGQTKARHMLATCYGAFTEGFDTRDLKSARSLLQRLTLEVAR